MHQFEPQTNPCQFFPNTVGVGPLFPRYRVILITNKWSTKPTSSYYIRAKASHKYTHIFIHEISHCIHSSEKKKVTKINTKNRSEQSNNHGDSQTRIVHNHGSTSHRVRRERRGNSGHSSAENRGASRNVESRKYTSSFLWLPPLNVEEHRLINYFLAFFSSMKFRNFYRPCVFFPFGCIKR